MNTIQSLGICMRQTSSMKIFLHNLVIPQGKSLCLCPHKSVTKFKPLCLLCFKVSPTMLFCQIYGVTHSLIQQRFHDACTSPAVLLSHVNLIHCMELQLKQTFTLCLRFRDHLFVLCLSSTPTLTQTDMELYIHMYTHRCQR